MRKPNLLYIFADQWRRQALGFMGEDPVHTPRMDRFAAESLVFDNALSACPLCSPHRASLMTGKYPLNTGVWTNCKTGLSREVYLRPDPDSFGNRLKREGYGTAYLGKWHLDYPEQNLNDEPLSGAEGWDVYTPPGERRQGFDYWHSYGAMDNHKDPHYWRDDHRKIKPGRWSVAHETDVALDYLKKRDRKTPFALFISYNPPHTPFDQVPEKYKALYKDLKAPPRQNARAGKVKDHTGPWEEKSPEELLEDTKNYYAAVTGIDDHVGRLLAYLKEEGLEEDTIVVLSADHGEMLGSHKLMHKHVWYEESVGIPFLLRWKGRVAPGRSAALLNSPDHLPTLLSLMDVKCGRAVEGFDYAGHIMGKGDEALPEDALLAAYPGRANAVAVFEEQGLNNLAYGWRALRTERHCYVIHRGYAPGEETRRYLYDLAADPFQMNPLILSVPVEQPGGDAGECPAPAMELRLKERLKAIGDPFGAWS